jgi:hypothetical protein
MPRVVFRYDLALDSHAHSYQQAVPVGQTDWVVQMHRQIAMHSSTVMEEAALPLVRHAKVWPTQSPHHRYQHLIARLESALSVVVALLRLHHRSGVWAPALKTPKHCAVVVQVEVLAW